MKVAHARCLDTSILYHHPRGRPLKPGLKWLMKKWANKDIQTRGEGGHDPEEDARACIDLMRLKLKNGKGFGLFMVDVENILERMGRSGGKTLKTAVVDYGKPSTWLGSKATSTIACTCDEDVVTGVKEMIHGHQFVFGRMLELSEGLGCELFVAIFLLTYYTNNTTFVGTNKKSNSTQAAGTPPAMPTSDTASGLEPTVMVTRQKTPEELYKSLNDNLTAIHNALPPTTAFILLSGHGDPRKMSEMSSKKAAFETAIREGVFFPATMTTSRSTDHLWTGKSTADIPQGDWWTSQEARLLEDEVERAKHGLLFLGIK
jgi:RNA exonuclease 1